MGCRAVFIGGIKSGKSKNAENYILNFATAKPIYLATTEFVDNEIKEKIKQHQLQRENNFITLEEPINLYNVIKTTNNCVLVEDISMWINNMLHYGFDEDEMIKEINKLLSLKNELVFVINDVSCSVVSENQLVRKFVNINGKISQLIAKEAKDIYMTTAGISVKINT